MLYNNVKTCSRGLSLMCFYNTQIKYYVIDIQIEVDLTWFKIVSNNIQLLVEKINLMDVKINLFKIRTTLKFSLNKLTVKLMAHKCRRSLPEFKLTFSSRKGQVNDKKTQFNLLTEKCRIIHNEERSGYCDKAIRRYDYNKLTNVKVLLLFFLRKTVFFQTRYQSFVSFPSNRWPLSTSPCDSQLAMECKGR